MNYQLDHLLIVIMVWCKRNIFFLKMMMEHILVASSKNFLQQSFNMHVLYCAGNQSVMHANLYEYVILNHCLTRIPFLHTDWMLSCSSR